SMENRFAIENTMPRRRAEGKAPRRRARRGTLDPAPALRYKLGRPARAGRGRGGGRMAADGRVGRNDPCACGSGRKYKRCCLAQDEAPELLRLWMRRAEGRLCPQVVAFAHDRWGYDLVTAAWWEFTCFEEIEAEGEEEALDRDEYTSAFLPWFV